MFQDYSESMTLGNGEVKLMNNILLDKVVALREEIANYVYGKGVTVPSDVLESIKENMMTPKLLERITRSVSASVGLDIHETLSDHFNGGYTLWGNYRIWTKESKDKVKSLLLEKIENAKITVKHNELFFFEEEKPSAAIRNAVLMQHKVIAKSAINYIFAKDESSIAELQVSALKGILALIDIPGAKPSSDPVIVRNMISSSRFQDITKKEANPAPSIDGMKEAAREWYQNSDREELYHKEGHHNFDYVKHFLYLLKPEQLEALRAEFLADITKRYDELKAEKWDSDAVSSAQYLVEKVKVIMSWQVSH